MGQASAGDHGDRRPRNPRSRFSGSADRAAASASVPSAIPVRTAIGCGSGLKFQKSPTHDSSGIPL